MRLPHPGQWTLALVAALSLTRCGPPPTTPQPDPSDTSGEAAEPADPAALEAECRRRVDEALAVRLDRARSAVDAHRLRIAVAAAVLPRAASESPAAEAVGPFGAALLAAPPVRDTLTEAVLGAAGDLGVQVSLLTSLLDGGADPRAQVEAAAARAGTALRDALTPDTVALWLARPDLLPLWDLLLPVPPFADLADRLAPELLAAPVAEDLRRLLVIPGDPEATAAAAAAWAERPAGLGCSPTTLRLPLPDWMADAPAVRRAASRAFAALLEAPAVRREVLAAVRDLLADAPFRLLLDELLVEALRGDDDPALRRAAAALLASPALPNALAAAARRLAQTPQDLPPAALDIPTLAHDPDLRSAVGRFLVLLATSEGCLAY